MIFIIDSKKYGKHEVLIDDEDAENVLKYKWHLGKQPKRNAIYARRNVYIKGKKSPIEMTLHKQLTGYKRTDHINGNGLDCTRKNMREATHAENVRNVGIKKNNSSGYKGVSWDKDDSKWVVRIQINKKNKTIGRYNSIDKAAISYNIAALKYHGEFANLNNVMEHK